MSDIDTLTRAIRRQWRFKPPEKVRRYIEQFQERTRRGCKIIAKVKGNHGIYGVSIAVENGEFISGCSCYIGEHGGCHHCVALGHTFLKSPESFVLVRAVGLDEVTTVDRLPGYLDSTPLEDLLNQLQKKGVSQKAFAESIGTSANHMKTLIRNERRNRYSYDLGATKLACLWVLDNLAGG